MDSLWKSLAEHFTSNRKSNFLWSYTCRSPSSTLGAALGLRARRCGTGRVTRPLSPCGHVQAVRRERSLLNTSTQLGSGVLLDTNYGPELYQRPIRQIHMANSELPPMHQDGFSLKAPYDKWDKCTGQQLTLVKKQLQERRWITETLQPS